MSRETMCKFFKILYIYIYKIKFFKDLVYSFFLYDNITLKK